MQKIEQILDQALSRMQNGENISAIVSSYPQDVQDQLSAYLSLVRSIKTFPVKQVPTPAKRKLYLQQEVQGSKFIKFLQTLRKTYPMAFASLVLAIAGTAYAAMSSLPGQRLYAVKKVFQSTQIQLAQTPEQKAQLQLQFADQNLQEAQQVLATKGTGDAQTVNEVGQQTVNALNNLKDIAASPAVSKNPAIIQKAESIAQNQQNLAQKINSPSALASAAQAESTLNDIKRIVAAANDESNAAIPKETQFDYEGAVYQVSYKNNFIKIDANTFNYDPQNISVKNADGKDLTIADIGIGDSVKISGTIQDSQNNATEIVLVKRYVALSQEVKVEIKVEKKEVKTEVKPADPAQVQPDSAPASDSAPIPAKPQDTFGGFIPESPTPTESK